MNSLLWLEHLVQPQMASILKLLSLTLFLGLVLEAHGQCSPSDISIVQSKTANFAHGMPEWSVDITNNCVCTQSQVKLNCFGFQTNEAVDPSILSVSSHECLLKNGTPLAPSETVRFLYAWDPQFSFQPISSQIGCSS